MLFQMAEPVRDISSSPGLLVRAGASYYRVSGSPGTEVAPCPALVTVPNGPHWLLGIGLHKNEAVPVVHLQALLAGRSHPAPSATRLLLLRDSGQPVAWLVDDVEPDDGRPDAAGLDLLGVARVLMAHAFLQTGSQ